MIIGGGARYLDLRASRRRGSRPDKLRSLPYQARDVLPLSLSSADLHFVGLAEGLAGFVVPSRLYGIMAAGRPVVVAADADSETAQVVERVGCGIVVPPSRPELLAEVIRDAYEGRYDLDAMGARGRAYVDGGRRHARRARPLPQVLRELAPPDAEGLLGQPRGARVDARRLSGGGGRRGAGRAAPGAARGRPADGDGHRRRTRRGGQ